MDLNILDQDARGGSPAKWIRRGPRNGSFGCSINEQSNRTYLTEVLDAYLFEFLEQVREISAEWG